MKYYFIGIDPGFEGAFAVVDSLGRAHVVDTPTMQVGRRVKDQTKVRAEYALADMRKLLSTWSAMLIQGHYVYAGLELVSARPGEGVTSSFRFGQGFGMWEMGLACHAIPYTRVTPGRWKSEVFEGVGTEKEASRQRAQQLFPMCDLSLKKHHGRAEALLIADYIRRRYQQGKL